MDLGASAELITNGAQALDSSLPLFAGFSLQISHVVAGAAVGLAIGVTGVGGGSLMTPLLLLFGYTPAVAIGTDLLYAALTKTGGVIAHHARGSIDWRVTGLLASGSLPSALLTHAALARGWLGGAVANEALLTMSLGVMLLLTAALLVARSRLQANAIQGRPSAIMGTLQANKPAATVIMGGVLGVCVTLSSVGAGAFAAAILMTIYADSPSARIVGTDIAHAVPLTLLAGVGYAAAGQVDYELLLGLLVGSLPAIQLGSRIAYRINEKVLRGILTLLLGGLGAGYLLSGAL
jgi:uncharacterized membrane protein YfcA